MPFARRWCSIWPCGLGLALAVLLGRPTVAFAAAPPVRIEVAARTSLPPDDQPTFEEAIAEAARQGAAEAEVTTRVDAEARLVIDVAWKDERRIDYVGRIEVHPPGEPALAPLAVRSFGCELCGASDFMVRLQQEVALALRGVTWPDPAPAPEQGAATGAITTADASEGQRRARRDTSLRPLGWAGVGTASAGLVAVTVGAVLWARDDRLVLRPEDTEGPVWKRSSRPPGIGLVAGGAAAAVIGGALVIVDLVRDRRRAMAMHPAVGLGLAGLHVEGRF